MSRKSRIIINGDEGARPEAVIPEYDRNENNPTPFAFLYGRVSTLDQDITCSAQEHTANATFENHYKPKGFHLAGMFKDPATSASKDIDKRPAASMLFKMARRGDVIIVAKMDRFSRSLLNMAQNMEMCKKHGIILHACDIGMTSENDTGRFLMGIMLLLAEWEKERMSTRRLEQINSTKLAGFAPGPAPLGFVLKNAAKIGTRQYRVAVPSVEDQVVLERCYFWHAGLGADDMTIARHFNKYKLKHLRKCTHSDLGHRMWHGKLITVYAKAWEEMMDTESNVLATMTPEELDAARRKQNECLVIQPFIRTHRRSGTRQSATRLRYLARQNLEKLSAGGDLSQLLADANGL